jgi:hypothetical protein
VEPLPVQLRPKELSPELRAHLWAVLYDKLKLGGYYAPIWVDILRLVHVSRNHRAVDEFEPAFTVQELKRTIFADDYVAVLGLVQWILRLNICPKDLHGRIQGVLTHWRAAYRLADGDTLVPFGSAAEGQAIERAFADL